MNEFSYYVGMSGVIKLGHDHLENLMSSLDRLLNKHRPSAVVVGSVAGTLLLALGIRSLLNTWDRLSETGFLIMISLACRFISCWHGNEMLYSRLTLFQNDSKKTLSQVVVHLCYQGRQLCSVSVEFNAGPLEPVYGLLRSIPSVKKLIAEEKEKIAVEVRSSKKVQMLNEHRCCASPESRLVFRLCPSRLLIKSIQNPLVY